MRKTIAVFVVLIALWLGYVAWPFVSLYDVVRAAQAGDVARIAQRVDFPALRGSLAGQIMQTYARLTGMRVDRTGLMVGLASSFADPFIEKLLTPAALVDLLKSGWPKVGSDPNRPAGTDGLNLGGLSNVWQLYLNSDYGLGEVRFSVPPDQPADRQFRVVFALSDWTWKLSGLGLPRDVQERLARELMKQQGASGQEKPAGG